MEDIGYNGQLYNDHSYAIKVRTGDDILNAAKDAVCGELMVAKGGQFPGLYIATKTSGDDIELCRISETIPENKLPIDNDHSLEFNLNGAANEAMTADLGNTPSSYSAYSFGGWVYFDEFINGGGPFNVVHSSSWNDWYNNTFTRVNSADSIAIYHADDTTYRYKDITYTLSLNTWHHFVQVWDGSDVKLYIDRVLRGTLENVTTWKDSGDNVIFEAGRGRNTYHKGKIDEAFWFDSALSASDVNFIYNNTDISSLNPIGWWRMGDTEGGIGSTITDLGSGQNDGALSGGDPTFSKDTPYNNSSLKFNGIDNYLDTGSNFSDTFNKDFSISLWFKGTTQIGQNVYSYFSVRDGSTPKDTILWIMRINTQINIRYRTDNTQNQDLILSTPFPEDNEWHHLGLAVRQVDNETEMILTLDGVSGTNTRLMHMADFQNTINFGIGARVYDAGNGAPDGYLNGNIDEFSIFDRALSNTEMAAIYNNGIPTNLYRHNPLHWWRMGENATTVRELNNYGSSAVNGYYMSDDRTPEIEDGDLFFDGVNDVVGLPPNIFNLGSDNFAISIWFKIDTPGTYGLLSIGNSLGRVSTVIMSDTSIRTTAYSPANNIDNDATVPQMATNTWHHFFWQKYGNSGGSQVKMYFNGVLVKDSILSSTTNFGADDLIYTGVGSSYEIASTIGFLAQFGGYYLDGGISEVAFWNNTLTDGGVSVGATAGGDIADIYNGGVVGKDISSYSPVHLWKPEREVIANKGRGDITPAFVGPVNYSLDTPASSSPFSAYSLEFNGTDHSLSTGLSVGAKSALTVSAWVNISTVQDSGFVQQYAAAGTNRTFRIIYASGGFWFQCYTPEGITEATVTNAAPPVNQWIHLVGTFDGATARIYIDNVRGTDGATLTSTTLQSASSNVEIGGSSGLAMFTDGLIDEVAIWDVELANNERDYLYNNGKPGDISSLQPLGWWRMGDDNNGTGSTITDLGSGGNDGTINGATFSTDTPSK